MLKNILLLIALLVIIAMTSYALNLLFALQKQKKQIQQARNTRLQTPKLQRLKLNLTHKTTETEYGKQTHQKLHLLLNRSNLF